MKLGTFLSYYFSKKYFQNTQRDISDGNDIDRYFLIYYIIHRRIKERMDTQITQILKLNFLFRGSQSSRAPRGLSREIDEASGQAATIGHRACHPYLQKQALPGVIG